MELFRVVYRLTSLVRLVKALTEDTVYQIWRINNEQKWKIDALHSSDSSLYSKAIFGATELIFFPELRELPSKLRSPFSQI